MSRIDPPQWLLERYRLGEVTAEQRARVERALATDPSVQQRLDALDRDSADILERHPPRRVAASISTAAGPSGQPVSRRWLGLGLAMAGVAAVVTLGPTGTAPGVDGWREKGAGATLALYVMDGQGPVPLADGARVKPGAVVQARYHVDTPSWTAVLSFDRAGSVTVHTPPVVLDGGTHAMDRSFELDATPGFERFVLITSPRPLSEEALVSAARAAVRTSTPTTTELVLDGPVFQRSVVLFKDTP